VKVNEYTVDEGLCEEAEIAEFLVDVMVQLDILLFGKQALKEAAKAKLANMSSSWDGLDCDECEEGWREEWTGDGEKLIRRIPCEEVSCGLGAKARLEVSSAEAGWEDRD